MQRHRTVAVRPRALVIGNLARVASLLAISSAVVFSAGCSGDGGGGNGGDGAGGGGAGGSGSNGSMDWSGNWSVTLDYGVDCDYNFGNVKHADNHQTNTMSVTADGNGGVDAEVNGYPMSGTAKATSMTLSGTYPVQDEGQSTAGDVDADTKITLKITTVTDADNAKGSIEGVFQGQFGATCTISNGKAVLSR